MGIKGRLAVRRWDKMLATLQITEPITIETLREAVSRRTGRPLEISQRDFGAEGTAPCGLWYRGSLKDYILVDQSVRGFQLFQTIGHEIGHMLLGHESRVTASILQLASIYELFETAPRELVADVLGNGSNHGVAFGRTTFGDELEDEAEQFGERVLLMFERSQIHAAESEIDPVLPNARDTLGIRGF